MSIFCLSRSIYSYGIREREKKRRRKKDKEKDGVRRMWTDTEHDTVKVYKNVVMVVCDPRDGLNACWPPGLAVRRSCLPTCSAGICPW